ncbi:MAG: PDZ domain-containing protein, partial [Vulcanimicrobiota bacterium]
STYALYLEFRLDDRDGVLVSYVSRGGAADEAGVEVGDVLIAVDGRAVHDLDSLEKLAPNYKEKDQVMLTLRRGKVLRYALVDLKKFSGDESR